MNTHTRIQQQNKKQLTRRMHAFSQNHHQFFALFGFHFLVSRLEFVDSTKVANKFSLPFSVVVAVVVGNEKREGYLDCFVALL